MSLYKKQQQMKERMEKAQRQELVQQKVQPVLEAQEAKMAFLKGCLKLDGSAPPEAAMQMVTWLELGESLLWPEEVKPAELKRMVERTVGGKGFEIEQLDQMVKVTRIK